MKHKRKKHIRIVLLLLTALVCQQTAAQSTETQLEPTAKEKKVFNTILADFIEAINATGRAKASDVWVELEHKGQYPELREITTGIEREGYEVDGECYDKIIYINPTNGQQLKAVAYNRDKENFVYNGKPLSDHSPVSAVFEWTAGSKESDTGIESASHPDVHGCDSQLFDLNGRRIKTTSDKGIFIERNDKGTFKHIIK